MLHTTTLRSGVRSSLLDLGVEEPMHRSLAMGTTSHGQGGILQESEEAGALSALAMGLAPLAMTLILPPASRLIL